MVDNVIKEFVVQLGVQTKQADFKRFEDGLAAISKGATKLAAGLVTMAGAATAAVTKINSQFEGLYYASQRIGASAQNIRGFSFALQQAGGTAQGARQSLENVASFMRSNPAGEGWIRQLGVQTRDAMGNMRDMTDITSDLGKAFKAMPYWAAKQRAQMLGIDEQTLQAMIRGIDQYRDRYHQMAQSVGVDQEAAAKAGRDFMNNLRDLLAYLELVGQKFVLMAEGPAKRIVDMFRQINEATGGLAAVAAVAAPAILALKTALGLLGVSLGPVGIAIGAVATAIAALFDDFMAWKEGSTSLIDWSVWAPQIESAMAAFRELGEALGGLLGVFKDFAVWLGTVWQSVFKESFGDSMLGAAKVFFNTLIAMVTALAQSIKVVTSLLKGDWKGAWEGAKQLKQTMLAELSQSREGGAGLIAAHKAGATVRQLGSTALTSGALQGALTAGQTAGQTVIGALGLRQGAAGDPRGLRNNNPGNLNFVGQRGATKEAGPGGRFAVFQTAEEGLSALANQLLIYGRRGINNVRDIIGKWAPPSENNTGAYIAAVARKLGVGATDRLNLQDPQILAGLMGAITQHENSRNPFSNEAMMQIASARLGVGPGGQFASNDNRGVTIHQNTTVNVASNDAHAAGDAVVNAQGRVNADLVRNAKGALG